MRIFVDTADLDAIREANSMGVLDGVTTNPSLISQQEGTFEEIILQIARDEVEGNACNTFDRMAEHESNPVAITAAHMAARYCAELDRNHSRECYWRDVAEILAEYDEA